MHRKLVLLLFATSVVFVSPFKIQQIEDGKAHVRMCAFKIGISPMEVNRLRKGDFSESDEKSHVSLMKAKRSAVHSGGLLFTQFIKNCMK